MSVIPDEEKVEGAKKVKSKSGDSSELDLVFCMDCTGSMGSYISSAQRSIVNIVEKIVSEEQANVRFAFIAYRDHPPQDTSFITKVHEFTDSPRKMREYAMKYGASGGGDGPEAVTAALHDALHLPYRKNAVKIIVIIADAPPHGLGVSNGDGFPNGDPQGRDPVKIAQEMAETGIILYVVACEPSLSGFEFAHDFFEGIAKITEGRYLPLTSAHLLPDVIIGGAQEEISLQRLEEHVAQTAKELKEKNPEMSESAIAEVVADEMAFKGFTYSKVEVDDIYGSYDTTNVDMVWNATSFDDVRSHWADVEQPAMNIPSASGPVLESAMDFSGFTKSVESAWSADVDDDDDDLYVDIVNALPMNVAPTSVSTAAPTSASTAAPALTEQRAHKWSQKIDKSAVTRLLNRKNKTCGS